MFRLTRRSLWEHKRRLLSTVIAVVLGVGFMAGTFVLTDTLDRTFDDLFAEGNAEVDAQVQGEVLFSDPIAGGDQRSLLDEGLVAEVGAVDGVARVSPYVQVVGFGSTNRVLGNDGEPIGASQGPPTLLENWVPDTGLSPYELQDGRGPETDAEIALNVAAAEEGELSVGDDVVVVSQFGRKTYELVGIFTFGTAKSAAGAVSAEFTLPEAQRLAGMEGQTQQVIAAAEEGLSQQELVDRIAPILPDGAEVITGEEGAAQLSSDVQSGFSFFNTALTIFGGIALLVGIFVISNTFSILVAQRTRELALLRAVGASRRQLLGSVLLEAVLVGLFAAGLGLLAGLGLAKGVTAALEASGADLPTSSLALRMPTIVISLVIGVGVTLVAALVPAIRGTRVPPLAALRDVAIDRSGASRPRLYLGIAVLAFAALNLSAAWTSDGDTDAIPTVGFGAVLVIIGAIIVGPVLAAPSVRVLGGVLPSLRGITGRLAMENAARSPKRTSATASALIIGVALVGFINVFAASIKEELSNEVDRGFAGDFVVQSDAGFFGPSGGFPAGVADTVADVDGVATAIGYGFARAQLTYPDAEVVDQFITAIDPTGATEVLTPRMDAGDLADLTDDGIIVDTDLADGHDVTLGDTINVRFAGGNDVDLTVQGISDEENVLGYFTLTLATFEANTPQALLNFVFGTVDSGADVDDVMQRVDEAVVDTPALEVLDRDGYVGDLASQINSFVTMITVLLGLSIIIALIGIANTMSLSINERVRELGLLRAVGMNRAQLRSAIRWEAVLISVLGTLVGLALGLSLSRAMTKALETAWVVPVGSFVVIALLAALAGVVASFFPARRASRMAILDAIAEH